MKNTMQAFLFLFLLILGLIISFFEKHKDSILEFFTILGQIFLFVLVSYTILCLSLLLYEYFYYKSEKFQKIKDSIKNNTKQCNELNLHIEELKKAYIDINKTDYGQARYIDTSKYNYKRPEFDKKITKFSYQCSLSVCRSAQIQPFKYLCKYFNIDISENTLEKFESILNDFSAAEQGKQLLLQEREKILDSIHTEIPSILLVYRKDILMANLGFDKLNFYDYYFPSYSFDYISAGGNSSLSCKIDLNIENLNKFIYFLSEKIKFKKSIAGQRMLMTSQLREYIKQRDNYTCQHCGLSIKDEPNLLLEIDHIVPLSKGGITTEKNLQTLCWKCNRKKSNKLPNDT